MEERELSRESQLLLQRDALMVKSAVRIQKWWRELIVSCINSGNTAQFISYWVSVDKPSASSRR